MTITYNIDGTDFTREELINGLTGLIKIMEVCDLVSLSKEYLGERLTHKAEELFDQMLILVKELSVNPTQELVDRYNKVIGLFKEEIGYTDQDDSNMFMLGKAKASELSDEEEKQILNITEELEKKIYDED